MGEKGFTEGQIVAEEREPLRDLGWRRQRLECVDEIEEDDDRPQLLRNGRHLERCSSSSVVRLARL